MSVPRSGPVENRGEEFSAQDLVLCESSKYPLALPSALINAILDQVNEGVRKLPHGGAEVGGLLLGRRSQTGLILAEEALPIALEYRYGPCFRMSPEEITALERRVAELQRQPSRLLVGFYRSRTRAESQTRASDMEILSALEQAHPTFATDFHYFAVMTPVGRTSMMTSVSLREEDGWGEWQHFTLPSHAPSLEEETRAGNPAAARSLPPTVARTEEETPFGQFDPSLERFHTNLVNTQRRRIPLAWYGIATAVLLAGAVGAYLRPSPKPDKLLAADIALATSPNRAEFAATRDGLDWKLSWSRDSMAALRPNGAVLSIRDGEKEKQIGLTPGDLASGTILYSPQSSDLLFSLNLILPGGRVLEEHVRVIGDGTGDSAKRPAVAAKTAPKPATQPAATKVPAPIPDPQPEFVPPEVLRSVNAAAANLPPSGPALVQVRVEISAEGAVTNATPVGATTADSALVDAALRAARFWTFEPARENGRAVPSSMTLSFRFSGN